MKPFYWILLALTSVLSALLLMAGIATHTSTPSIYGVSETAYKSIIGNTIGKHNKNFAQNTIYITDTQYVEDTISVVKATAGETPMVFVFEYYNGTVFLTNYTSGAFSQSDFNNSSITPYINGAISVS